MDITSRIIAYELGELSDQETVELFQDLINNGMVWHLQGHYQRQATMLIQRGFCHRVIDRSKSSPSVN